MIQKNNISEDFQEDLRASVEGTLQEIKEAGRSGYDRVELERLPYSNPEIQQATLKALKDRGYKVDRHTFICEL